MRIEDRVETLAERECFITLKDHKDDFENNPKCRLINPTKSELGKVSKKILERIVEKTKAATGVNIWHNTYEVLDWFEAIENKHQATFICFDIVEFYPSISKSLLAKALDFASQYVPVTDLERNVIFHAKKTLLFNHGTAWAKKSDNNELFDIPMGSYDGAEGCELVVCFILSQLKTELGNMSLGLYRDDGLAVSHGSPRQVENLKKKICTVFRRNELRITVEANKKIINYLDVTLNLNTGKHQP